MLREPRRSFHLSYEHCFIDSSASQLLSYYYLVASSGLSCTCPVKIFSANPGENDSIFFSSASRGLRNSTANQFGSLGFEDPPCVCKVRQEGAMEARGPNKPFHVHIKLGLSHADTARKNDYSTIRFYSNPVYNRNPAHPTPFPLNHPQDLSNECPLHPQHLFKNETRYGQSAHHSSTIATKLIMLSLNLPTTTKIGSRQFPLYTFGKFGEPLCVASHP